MAGFVGRQDELAILSERFSEAARGRPQVVYLEGEAGSGKSTLLSRFLGSLSGAVVLQAGGDEDESLLRVGAAHPGADAHARAARAAAERFPRALTTAAAAMAGTSLAFARGDWAGVIDAAEPVRAAGPPSVGGLPGVHNWRAFEADALVGSGRLGDAERALDEFDSVVPHGGLGSAVLALARCRGNLAAAMGDETGAEQAFSHARSITTMAPMPFEVALLNLDDGRRLCGFGHGPVAVARLEEAHKAFSHLGADPFVQACATELAALQVTAATGSPAALLGLSRSELAVARLAATGLTNREVASQLFVSVKTVEYHLRNSYIKLDITSRRALAALLA